MGIQEGFLNRTSNLLGLAIRAIQVRWAFRRLS